MHKIKPYEQNVFLFLITFSFLFFVGINQMSKISGTATFISMIIGATASYFFLKKTTKFITNSSTTTVFISSLYDNRNYSIYLIKYSGWYK